MESQEQIHSSSRCLLIALLLIVLVGAILYALSQLGKGGQGGSFDAAPYTLHLAQKMYQWRKTHGITGHNFGGGIIVVQYADGSAPSVYESPVYEGQDGPPQDVNAFHSERQTQENFILPTLTLLRQHGIVAKASEIDVISRLYALSRRDACLAKSGAVSGRFPRCLPDSLAAQSDVLSPLA